MGQVCFVLSGDRARIDIEDRLGRSFIVLARDRMRGGQLGQG